MAFTAVTISHDFDLPAGALGTVSFTPVEPMHNGGKTVAGTVTATLDGSGALSQVVDATTDPGTTPVGVHYRVILRVSGQPPTVWYTPVPHAAGSTIDLSTLLAWASTGTGGGVVTSVQGATGDVVLTADSFPDGDTKVQMLGAERLKLAGVAPGATAYTAENARDDLAAALVAGANVTITPNDAADTITIAATGGSSGIPASTVTAKGDLIAATASAAVDRLGVGADGLVLVASSAAPTGLAWAAPTPAYTDTQARAAMPQFLPSDYGYLTWSVDPVNAGNSNPPTAGVLYLVEVKIIAAGTVASIDVNVANGGAGLANCYLALYNSAGSRVGVSADQATSWQSGGTKSVALGASAAVSPGKYYVGILVGSATTSPAISRASTSTITNIGRTAPYRSSSSGTGQTATPASVTLSGVAAENNAWFVGLK